MLDSSPRCCICSGQLKRNGHTSAGRARYRCKDCGASSTTPPRPDVARRHEITRFVTWLLGTTSQEAAAGKNTSARTFRRKTAWCWQVEPTLAVTGVIHDEIQLDGIYLSSHWCALIAIANGKPIALQWSDTEKSASWKALLQQIPAPRLVVMDGGTGLASAIKSIWPEAKLQRCLVHIQRNVRQHLTLRPKTEAGRALRKLSLALTRITTSEEATNWLIHLNAWHSTYESLLKERTYLTASTTAPVRARLRAGQRWWYTHERLRKAYNVMANAHKAGTLFTYLDPAFSDFKASSTTNQIEGGINAQLRELLRRHRGMSSEHQRRAVQWWLVMHQANPPAPITYVRPEHYTPRQETSTPHAEDSTAPKVLDTAFSPEDGNGIQHGWAGRSRP